MSQLSDDKGYPLRTRICMMLNIDPLSNDEKLYEALFKVVERIAMYENALKHISKYKPVSTVDFNWQDQWHYVRKVAAEVLGKLQAAPQQPAAMDYHGLLCKYIALIDSNEGTDFLSESERDHFSPDEWQALLSASRGEQPAASLLQEVCENCGEELGMHNDKTGICRVATLTKFKRKPAADAGAGDVKRALAEAVAAIYFADNSEYGSALWSVVKALGGKEAAELLGSDDEAAYQKYVEQVLK